MDAFLDAIQNIVTTEPETETLLDSTQVDGGTVETQLTKEISTLWSDNLRLSGNRRATAKELRLVRTRLAERLHAMKSLLCRPDLGPASQWRSWLNQHGIPRSTADRLVARHAETLCSGEDKLLSGAPSEQAESSAEKLAQSMWQRIGKLLTTDVSVIRFIGRIAELSGVNHEQRAEGLVIFNAVPKVGDGLPGSAPATDPAPQLSGEVPAITAEPKEESAATPTEPGLVVAATEMAT